jgi:two-component system alkaline phosphatase synthesis response regulator PhoP
MMKREEAGMPHILLVEDDDTIRLIIKEVLESSVAECSVASCATGMELLQLLNAQQPHAILLDVRLPDIDGLTLYKEIRSRVALATVPVLFVTANPDLVARARLDGHYDVLRKPFDLVMLTTAVRSLLKQEIAYG